MLYILFVGVFHIFKPISSQDSLYLIDTMTGEQTGDMFSVVAGVGDLNNDGFGDITSVSNHINIFFGNTLLDSITDISTSFWATPVCGLGDINND